MRYTLSRRKLVSVSDEALHIAIDVTCADDELRGSVSDGVQAPTAFSGWLGLIGALDAMMGSLRQDSPTPHTGTRDRVTSVNREGDRCP